MMSSRSLWMGDLEPYMDETFVTYVFQSISSQVISVKTIKRRDNGLPAGYCFIEFRTEEEAERVLKAVNGKEIPGTTPTRRFRLNRAQGGKNWDIGPSFSIFVGDLDTVVTDDRLEDFFLKKYRSVKGGKVMYDESGDSRGYGFVRFGDEAEQKRALLEMQGAVGLGTRAIKVSHATPKNKTTDQTSTTQSYSTSSQWWQQYQDYNQYYQQYYNYYNYQQQQQQQQQQQNYYTTAQQSQQYSAQTATSPAYQNKRSDKFEDPGGSINIAVENAIYMAEHSGFIDDFVDCHWQPLDTITSKIPELTTT
ncbi:tRNA selenocysteine 1-associated protein 1-like isoform X4 [Styela clava]|uniref:tRNA selenocysteine 1-associated protein 1-like isoform X4 n=1 Tax=Styela clava TaxID=7725 RepID=UPI00193A47CB|nr:tRNA selenocysteine 1-associated protein 1-like isoform X4 [Styela clava]